MFTPLFSGMAPLPPTRIRQGEESDAAPNYFAPDDADRSDEPGERPPATGRPGTRPGRPPPGDDTVIQPPGAIVVRPRLTVPPAREPLQYSTLAAAVGQLHNTSTVPLLAVTGDIFAGGSSFQAPGVFIPAVHVTPENTVGTRLLPYGILGLSIFYDPALARDFTGLFYLSAGNFGLFALTAHGSQELAVLGFLSNNFASVGISHYALSGSVLEAFNIFLVGWRDYLGLSGQFVWADSASQVLAIGGGLVAKTARRDVFDLGNYNGASTKEIAQAHNIPEGTPLRRVELRKRTGNTLQVRGGGGMVMLAGMLRFDMNTNKDVAYRTFLTPSAARDLLFEGSGALFFLKGKARALGWMKDRLVIPDPQKPESIPLGDEIQLARSGTYSIGLLVGQLAGWITMQGFYRRDLEISIRRVSQHTMEVTVTPIQLRASNLYALDPFGPHAGGRGTRSAVARQILRFDLRNQAARKAYLDVVKGRIPKVAPKTSTLKKRHLTPQQVTQAARDQKTTLPDGVERTYLHTLEGTLSDVGGGIKLLFVPTEILPRGLPLALTTHRQRSHETQTVTDGQVHHNADGYAHLRVAERLFGGRKAIYTLAQHLSHGTVDGPTVFDQLHLSSTYNDTRLRGSNYNKRLVGTVNTLFGAGIKTADGKHVREERQMQVSRKLDAKALSALSHWNENHSSEVASMGTIHTARVARASGVSHRNIGKFLGKMSAAPTSAERALVVQKFIQSHNVKSFSAVHHLLDNDFGNVNVSTNSSVYDTPLSKTEALCLKYLDPVTGATPPKVVAQRYKAVEKVLLQLQKAQREVQDDPLIDNARDYYLMLFKGAEERLHALLNVPPAQAAAVQKHISGHHLKRAWHARVHQGITPFATVMEPFLRLREAWQNAPLPQDEGEFVQRFRAMYSATRRIQRHLHYLEKDGALVAPEERHVQIMALRQARETLMGPGRFSQGHFAGLMNVWVLTPAQRASLLQTLRHAKQDSALKALRRELR